MRKETSQKAFVYHSIPSSRKFDVANKQKNKKNYSKEELGTFVGELKWICINFGSAQKHEKHVLN